MKILIIHDRKEMAAELEAIARKQAPINTEVQVAFDVFTARDKLRDELFDLAIVDLTLPLRAGQLDTQLAHAEQLLAEIFERGDINVPGDILGISKEADIIELIRTTIGQHLMACVEEDVDGVWKKAVIQKIHYVARARQARQRVTNASYDYDLLIITALDVELAPYREFFDLFPSNEFAGAETFIFQCKAGKTRRGVLFSAGFSGQAKAASATQALIMYFRPRLALMTGFCGGVEKQTSFGDLLVFRASYAWDYGKWVDEADKIGDLLPVFRPRPTPINAPENGVLTDVRKLLRNYEPSMATLGYVTKVSENSISDWKTEITAAASGSAVVTASNIVDQITALDDNICGIEMESYAFYLASTNTPVIKPDFLCLKSVADHCNGQKNSKLHTPCSYISADFARVLITAHYDFK